MSLLSCNETLRKLQENNKDAYEEACRILVKVADNILANPSNAKFRTLLKTNNTISKKVLAIKGGLDSLKFMGFQETSSDLTLPMAAPLNKLQLFKDEITKNKTAAAINVQTGAIPKTTKATNQASVKEEAVTNVYEEGFESTKRIVLPPLKLTYANPFLQEIERYFHQALVYGNKELQKRALKYIPVHKLENIAKIRLRALNVAIKQVKVDAPEYSVQDMLLFELLAWFKDDFFSWVDSPNCQNCDGETSFSKMLEDTSQFEYTNRVELHKCSICNIDTPFPRYNDLNILLETRKGRCGEFANMFTLFCKSMGWDSRIVFDKTDHVWTEVYSSSQKRWLHCDSCEKACDTPLVYENGWNKTITYVLAYSDEEVQDVTFRYTSKHSEVRKLRKLCPEETLAEALNALNNNRQKTIGQQRQQYLKKRRVFELIELMVEKKPSGNDQKGRISGSEAWKLSRNETKIEKGKKIEIFDDSVSFTLKYNTAYDQYLIYSEDILKETHKNWSSLVYDANNVFRKEEKDWKQVYLCRTEGETEGSITWYFQLKENSAKCIDSVQLKFDSKLYANGKLKIILCGENACLPFLPQNNGVLKTVEFSGSTFLKIECCFTGGAGPVAWQHAQIFRQGLDGNDFPFTLTINLKSV